ncbi:undecaprenyl-diphosphatase UppP [Bacteroidetes/Chlorobi group bacterium Naka2016]|nr:MAG: undecaprenyl-diphosphatase UppP [Bacteroidetes/Chlorobi group bacterium Naka2016]
MEILYAIIIGIVQGLTEFLPVSSTAHMTIVAKLLGANAISDPKVWTATMATIQLGTLASLLFYFRKEIVSIFVAMAKEPSKFRKEGFSALQSDDRLGWLIVIGSIPIFILGYLLKDFIEGEFTKSFWTISTSLIIVALILWVAEKTGKFTKSIEDVSLLDAFLVGVAQCFALIPGVSRSGATITAGLFLGFKREEAARFSFLLSIPAVFVSGVYEFVSNFELLSLDLLLFLAISTITAFVSGIFAISFLLNYLKRKSTLAFVVYRIVLGVSIILWFI